MECEIYLPQRSISKRGRMLMNSKELRSFMVTEHFDFDSSETNTSFNLSEDISTTDFWTSR